MSTRAQRTAILFPGQGSQTPEMREVAVEQRPDLLEQALAELGADPFERLGEGTHFAQPAVFCASLAYWQRAGSPRGDFVCGHSLGELAALVAAGAVEAGKGLRLTVLRGRLMDGRARQMPGAMLAVLGGGEEVREVALRLGLAVANENAPGEIVLSGRVEAIDAARREVRSNGLKAIRLPVSGAFHSPLMEPAAERFRKVLEKVDFATPKVPVFCSTTAAEFEDVPARLAAALTEPVVWMATLRRLRQQGVTRFLETGPGSVLTGLVRRTLPDVEARSCAEEVLHA